MKMCYNIFVIKSDICLRVRFIMNKEWVAKKELERKERV
jgi:hypothetical protein